MSAFIAILSLLLCSVAAVKVRCASHVDCTTTADWRAVPYGKTQALCEKGYCVSLLVNKKCTRADDCAFHQTCMNGKCVVGGEGDDCNIGSVNCAPGYACDAKTKKCVKGVNGVTCRDKQECGFGHSCYQVLPLPKQRALRKGTCKPGKLGSFACRRDSHCVGDLRCLQRFVNWIHITPYIEYKCSKVADFSKSRFPLGFKKCDLNNDCGPHLQCVNGRCQPTSLGQFCNYDYSSSRQCPTFTACVNKRCVYAKEGDRCFSEVGGLNFQCAPGFRCTAPQGVGLGRPGICTKGVEFSKCDDGAECADGLICGTAKKCVKSAYGQRCRSNYWCPAGLECHMYTNRCAYPKDVPARARYPAVRRAPKCRTRVDCAQQTIPFDRNHFCFNGICLPRTLGWACTPGPRLTGTFCDGGIEIEGTLGNRCSNSRNCLFGLVCQGGICVNSSLGASCASDYNCKDGQICQDENFRYVCSVADRGEKCRAHSHCKPPLRCLKSIDRDNGHFRAGQCALV